MKTLTTNQKQLIAFGALFIAVAIIVAIMAIHGVIHIDKF
jgi:hypothetical protein